MLTIILASLIVQVDVAEELPLLLQQAGPSHAKEIRLAALDKLIGVGGKDPKRTLESLAPYAREDDAEIRQKVVTVIGASGDTICPLPVVEALDDRDEGVRSAATTVLAIYHRFPRKAVPMLFAAAESKDSIVRASVPFALADAAGKKPQVLKTLKLMFTDSEPRVRNNAHAAHFQLTGDFDVYVPHLLRITTDFERKPDGETTVTETLALVGAIRVYDLTRQQPKDLARALVANLAHAEPAMRQCALRHLRAMCISSKASFRAVAERQPEQKLEKMAANDEDAKVRSWAAWVRDILRDGPPENAPEQLEPLETFQPSEALEVP
ncbi:MAG: HEAT repeat domain-containing protein [Planctomycetes bacterium]|nr:HEAT repeat domain-containing protein [Planctomycetota bacterium]